MNKSKFIAISDPKLQNLIEYIQREVNFIVMSALQKNAQGFPKPHEIMINEYMVMMQVVSHSMMGILDKGREATEMVNTLTQEELKKFFDMTETEKRDWADRLQEKVRRDKNTK